jgi:hypothetical protein
MKAEGQPVSLRFTESKNTLQPVFSASGALTELSVTLQLEGEPLESEQNHPIPVQKLEAAVADTVSQWMEELILAMRSTKCDFLGLGPRIAVSYPREMTAAPLPWTEQLDTMPMFAEIQCTIHHKENESRTKEGQA